MNVVLLIPFDSDFIYLSPNIIFPILSVSFAFLSLIIHSLIGTFPYIIKSSKTPLNRNHQPHKTYFHRSLYQVSCNDQIISSEYEDPITPQPLQSPFFIIIFSLFCGIPSDYCTLHSIYRFLSCCCCNFDYYC